MNSIFQFMQNGVSFIVPMIVLLGLLIFVHELGHFLVAKYYKVRVEVFSLGFGPKLFKFRKGDTTYAISAIPLGGYVKMFGDDPTAEIPESEHPHSFTHKPVGQRIAVVLAGPIMNFLFAIVLFTTVAFLGEPTLAPKLGDIKTDTDAYAAGFRSGDTVLSAEGHKIQNWEEFQKAIEANGDESLQVEVMHEKSTEKATLRVTPKNVANKNVMSWDKKVGEVDGLSYSARSSVIGVSDMHSAAAIAGIKPGDMIVAIDDVKVDKWRELGPVFVNKRTQDEIKLTLHRDMLNDQPEENTVTAVVKIPAGEKPSLAKETDGNRVMAAIGLESPELFLAGFVEKESPAKKAGLKMGDKITAVDSQPVHSFDEVAKIIRSHESADVPITLAYLRDGSSGEVAVKPNMKERMSPQFKEEKRFEIGIKPMIIDAMPEQAEWSAKTPMAALARGASQTGKWTSLTVLGFVRLFQAQVSAKNIGGFFSIGQMAKKSWQVGLSPFLNVMAIISLNLFILNLLPVPVLDGGHLVFFSIEALRGAPLSMRKLEIAQQVGLILLFGLMVFALFNDVSRMFNSSW